MDDSKQPIIIKKVVKRGHGHHGGAWKVAYADFVTAMMALFIVLWLMNTDDNTKKAIAGYFRDPAGLNSATGSGVAGTGENLTLQQQDMGKLKEKIEDILKTLPEFDSKLRGQVAMTVTGEGLRVELLETEKGMFFESGNARPTASGTTLITTMSSELAKLPNKIAIEGHTDAQPFSNDRAYGNWELSVDRANAARRLMEQSGLKSNRISEVRGFSDQRLRSPSTPDDPSNRRISIVVRYGEGPAPAGTKQNAPAAAAGHH